MNNGQNFKFKYTLERENQRTQEPQYIEGELSCTYIHPSGNDCFGQVKDIRFTNTSGGFRLSLEENEEAEEYLLNKITDQLEIESTYESLYEDMFSEYDEFEMLNHYDPSCDAGYEQDREDMAEFW